MKFHPLFSPLAAALLAISLLHAQQLQQPKPPATQTPLTGEGKETKKPRRQRVITNLSGFDLLQPQRRPMVVGATRGLPRPVALAPRLGKLYGTNPIFAWSYEGKSRKFIFVLRDDAQEEIHRAEVTGTSY